MPFYLTVPHVRAMQGVLANVALPVVTGQMALDDDPRLIHLLEEHSNPYAGHDPQACAPAVGTEPSVIEKARHILKGVDAADPDSVQLMHCKFTCGDLGPKLFPAIFFRARAEKEKEQDARVGFLVVPRGMAESLVYSGRMYLAKFFNKTDFSLPSDGRESELETTSRYIARLRIAPQIVAIFHCPTTILPDLPTAVFNALDGTGVPSGHADDSSKFILSAAVYAQIFGTADEYAMPSVMQDPLPEPVAVMMGKRPVWEPPQEFKRLFEALDFHTRHLEISDALKKVLQDAGIYDVGDAAQKTREEFLAVAGGNPDYTAQFEEVLTGPLSKLAKRPLRFGMAGDELAGWTSHRPIKDILVGDETLGVIRVKYKTAGELAGVLDYQDRVAKGEIRVRVSEGG